MISVGNTPLKSDDIKTDFEETGCDTVDWSHRVRGEL
jgi:hypothetical protein